MLSVIVYTLLGIAVVLIVFGLYLFWTGLPPRVDSMNVNGNWGDEEEGKLSFTNQLFDFMKKCFTIMFDRDSTRSEVRMASGAFFVLLGLAFLSGSVVVAIVDTATASSETVTTTPST